MLTPTETEVRALRMLDASRPYQPPRSAEEVRQNVLTYLLRDITPDILGTCTHIALAVFDRTANSPYEYSKETYDKLVDIKKAIEADLEEKLVAYRAQVKVMAQANLRLYVLQIAKSPNKKAIEAAEIVSEAEASALVPFKEALLDAQRAEHYIRAIPSVYKSQDADAAIWAIGFYLRNNGWNAKAPKTAHADAERFIREQFNK